MSSVQLAEHHELIEGAPARDTYLQKEGELRNYPNYGGGNSLRDSSPFPIREDTQSTEDEVDPMADLQEILKIANEYRGQNSEEGLNRITAYISNIFRRNRGQNQIRRQRELQEYRSFIPPEDFGADPEDTERVIAEIVNQPNWNFSQRAVNPILADYIKRKGMDVQAQRRFIHQVDTELIRFRGFQNFEQEFDSMTSNMSTYRTSLVIPQIVSNYALKLGRKLTDQERQALENHARQRVVIDENVMQEAETTYQDIIENPHFKDLPPDRIRLLVSRTLKIYNPQVINEVVKRVAERQQYIRATNEIAARVRQDLNPRTNTPLPQYIDQTIGAYIAENDLYLTAEEVSAIRNRLQNQRENYQNTINRREQENQQRDLERVRINDQNVYPAINEITNNIRAQLNQGALVQYENNPDEYINHVVNTYINNPNRYIRPMHRDYILQAVRQQLVPEFIVVANSRDVANHLERAINNPNMPEDQVRQHVNAYINEHVHENTAINANNRRDVENRAVERVMRRLAVQKLVQQNRAQNQNNDQQNNPRSQYQSGQSEIHQQRITSLPQREPLHDLTQQGEIAQNQNNDQRPINIRINEQMDNIANRILDVNNGTYRDRPVEEVNRMLEEYFDNNNIEEYNGYVEINGLHIDKNQLLKHIMQRKNVVSNSKKTGFWNQVRSRITN